MLDLQPDSDSVFTGIYFSTSGPDYYSLLVLVIYRDGWYWQSDIY